MNVRCECQISDIPRRLHWANRSIKKSLNKGDWLYMRHEPLPDGEPYVGKIPGHDHLGDQSVNSRKISGISGSPKDVLYDTQKGQHFRDYQIAKFSVNEVRTLNLPNPNVITKKIIGKTAVNDVYTFVVVHVPTSCMYPHCEIHAYKNGDKVDGDVKNSMRTVIRMQFAKIAEKNRIEIQAELQKEATPLGRFKRNIQEFWGRLSSCGFAANANSKKSNIFISHQGQG